MRISDLSKTRGIFITEGILMNNSTDKLTAVNCRSQTRHMSALPEVVTIFQYRSEEAKKIITGCNFESILPQEHARRHKLFGLQYLKSYIMW